MALTSKHIAFIKALDHEARQMMASGGEEALLMSLCDKMDDIKTVIDAAGQGELDQYCQQYEGFYHYMHLLEKMAQGCASGAFNDILKGN